MSSFGSKIKLFKGPGERVDALCDMLNSFPTSEGINGAESLKAFSFFLIACDDYYLLICTHKIDFAKVLLGGFIDTYICDQIVQRQKPKCPFAGSSQNIFGCIDCDCVIKGSGLNDKCSHAKRWLE